MLFGEQAQVLEEKDNWRLVETTHDQYQGWVDARQLRECSQNTRPFVLTTSVMPVQCVNGGVVMIPGGAFIHLKNETVESFYWAGETFNLLQPISHEIKRASIALAAHLFLGAPYLWGGRTIMGIDCSGFTQVVYRMAGVNIPRDAWQQAAIGIDVPLIGEAQTGDLAFFHNEENRIVHVGIVLRENAGEIIKIIHASGQVRIDQLDHQGIFNPQTSRYTHYLRMIRRTVSEPV
jgi:cell wall-associated NlpC family hydrolase